MLKEKINFIPKLLNPANVPQARPIEDFWAELKRMIYARGWSSNTIKQLINRINRCLNKN